MLLYVNWDGFSYDWYQMAREDGGTPNLDAMAARGAILRAHYCGIPAITNPMQQTLVAGAWPEKTGNCYAYFDKTLRRVVQTLRRNDCENICEAAIRQGKTCASVHGWYFENRGCVPGDASRPYIQNNLPNFETRVSLLLDYLDGKPVPSGDTTVTMGKRPDFLSLYADDIDAVCHNGRRLPYPELSRASTLGAWRDNLRYTVRRMDQALGRLLALPDTTVALAADHGGMPFGAAEGGEADADAKKGRLAPLVAAIQSVVPGLFVFEKADQTPPQDAEAVLLPMGTQALLTYLTEPGEAKRREILRRVAALPFVHRCLDRRAQAEYGAPKDFCDVYVTSRSPYYFGGENTDGFVGGSHAAMEESVLHVFCALAGKGIRRGVSVSEKTDLTCFAPTLAALMGIDAPADATGAALTAVLEES